MKYVIINEVGSVYRDNNGILEVAPLHQDGSFYEEDFGEVAEDIVGSEPLTTPYKGATKLSGLYDVVRSELNMHATPKQLNGYVTDVYNAMQVLNENWDNERLEHYPTNLPSFDELAEYVGNIKFK